MNDTLMIIYGGIGLFLHMIYMILGFLVSLMVFGFGYDLTKDDL